MEDKLDGYYDASSLRPQECSLAVAQGKRKLFDLRTLRDQQTRIKRTSYWRREQCSERERTPTFVREASVNMKQNSAQQRNVRNPLKPEERNTWKNLWQPYSGPSVVVVLTSKNGKPHASSTTQSAEWIPLKKGRIIRPTVTTIQVATKTL